MTVTEKRWLTTLLQAAWSDSTLTAYTDGTIGLKRAKGNSPFTKGKWKHAYGPKYTLTISDGPAKGDFDAIIQGNRIVVSQDKLALVFEK